MGSNEDVRAKLGVRLVYVTIGALIVLAGLMVIGAWGKNDYKDTMQLLLSSLLPLFGTWVGTVLAFYFSKENFEAASQGTLDVVRSISQRLVSTKITDAWMPRSRMTTLDLPAGAKLEDVVADNVAAKFDNVGANGQRISRLPILDSSGKFVAFLHRGVWTEMLATALRQSAGGLDMKTATLGSMLTAAYPLGKASQNYGDFIRSAAGFVGRDRSVADAKALMEGLPGCQDIIVTDHGKSDEPVAGWISNVDIGRVSQA